MDRLGSHGLAYVQYAQECLINQPFLFLGLQDSVDVSDIHRASLEYLIYGFLHCSSSTARNSGPAKSSDSNAQVLRTEILP